MSEILSIPQIREVISELTKSDTYKVSDNEKVSGSIFIVRELNNYVEIEIPKTFKDYIFTKQDLELMTKAKRNEKMQVHELDYWDNYLREKSKKIVLLKEADILGISGKYNKRLYTLLGQFKSTGFYVSKMENFKKTMEISENYRMYDINRRVLEPAIKELKNKTGVEITEIRKIKKGRKIDRIEFDFKFPKKVNSVKTKKKKSEQRNEISETMILFKEKVIEQIKDNYILRSELAPLTYQDDIEAFIIKHNIKL